MKAAVVTFPGSNCDRDLAVALEQAGAEVVAGPSVGEAARSAAAAPA